MNDTEPAALIPMAAAQVTSGALLRQAREAKGLHIGALAVALKVPVKKLEALEGDRFDLLPDTVFVRALASSVCRVLKVEPDEILARLPHSTTPRIRDSGAGINVPFHSAGAGSLHQLWAQLPKPLVLAVVALLTGALLLIFLPFARQAEVAGGAQQLPPQVSSQPGLVPPVGAASTTLVSQPALPAASAKTEVELVAGSGATTGIVVFTTQALSWVEVVDASGVVQLRRNMAPGETVGVSGTLPMLVVVGRSDTTQVLVRGQVFDLLSVAKDNVARFEVK